MRFGLCLIAFAALLGGCSSSYPLSGRLVGDAAPPLTAVSVGLVADSQFQTFQASTPVLGMSGEAADWFTEVALRPPALNWSSRSMLWTHLEKLKAEGARAIFYIGDGANNGCSDEFSDGLPLRATNYTLADRQKLGVLPLLALFRREAGIPVFFILGNHDFLGAGNTSHTGKRTDLCTDDPTARPDLLVTKWQAMELVDSFNRESARNSEFQYRSNLHAVGAATKAACESATHQARQRGCFLAATVDHVSPSGKIQFLLVDNNDFVDVSQSAPDLTRAYDYEYEGLRGAVSFEEHPGTLSSQTGWFRENGSAPVDMRVALMHYPLHLLRKTIPLVGPISAQSQAVADLFTENENGTRRAKQRDALFLTAHTHDQRLNERWTTLKTRCINYIGCSGKGQFEIGELNIGSTTDYPAYSALARLVPASGERRSEVHYRAVNLFSDYKSHCAPAYSRIQAYRSSIDSRVGWDAFGIDVANPNNYRRFGQARLKSIFSNLELFLDSEGQSAETANCIGMFASDLERKQSTITRPFG